MVATTVQPAHEAIHPGEPFQARERTRIVGALAALLASLLLATGGLLWREHARAAHPPASPARTVLR